MAVQNGDCSINVPWKVFDPKFLSSRSLCSFFCRQGTRDCEVIESRSRIDIFFSSLKGLQVVSTYHVGKGREQIPHVHPDAFYVDGVGKAIEQYLTTVAQIFIRPKS